MIAESKWEYFGGFDGVNCMVSVTNQLQIWKGGFVWINGIIIWV